MQKVIAFLEKNVEWVALGLGGLFLLWMVYGYVLQKPVVSKVGGVALTPGEVDAKTWDGPAQKLQAAINSTELPKMEVSNFISDLIQKLDPQATALTMATPWAGFPVPENLEIGPQINNTNAALAMVKDLPKPAKPDTLKVEQGRSNVAIPPAAPPADPNIPANPIVVAAAATGPGAGSPADRNWVSISATIHTKPLAAEYKRTNIPVGPLATVTILRVDLVRQERDSEGNFGKETVIGPLPTVNLVPFPDQKAGLAVQLPYVKWAEQRDAQVALLQPPFYQVLQADPWVVPGTPPPPVAAVPEAPFDPSKVTDTSTLTPEQRAQYDEFKKQQRQQKIDAARQRQQQRQQGPPGGMPGFGPPGPGGGGYSPGPGRGAVDDPDRPLTLAQAMPRYGPGGPGGYPGGYPGAYPGGYPGHPPFGPGPMGMMGAMPNGENTPLDPSQMLANAAATLPQQGAFDPNTQQDIVIWAHDDTVQPGKTYRYKLRYYIKNPVLQTRNVCNPQNLADIFSLVSEESAWTDPISVKSETNFFAITTSPQRNSQVKFEIFRWKNGAWQMGTADAGPGDMVGTVDPATKTDFRTGLTLVDVRSDPRNPDNHIVLLTNESGQLTRHDVAVDRNSSEYKKLKEQVESAKKAATPAGAAASAGPAPGGP